MAPCKRTFPQPTSK
jgi:hypothetical protein